MTDEPAALYEVRDHVGIITLNRPRALNSVNAALSVAVGEALEAAEADPGVRVVVVTGRGRAFCAGADLKELAQGNPVHAPEHPEWGFAGLCQHWITTPTIAAVNGYAMGGGTEIVLACDLAVVDETASLGLPEVKRGLMAAAGGVLRLQRQVPLKVALEVALTGEPLTAEVARSWGLVNRIAPQGEVLDVALQLAASIAEGAPLAVRESKRLVHETVAMGSIWTDDDIWAANARSMEVVFGSRDGREGPTAFAEKRAPVWEGR